MSTTRSDEDWLRPGPTLSYGIVGIDLSWPDIVNLAMNIGLDGLSTRKGHTAGLEYVA